MAILTALAILFAAFMHPPVHEPGVSISKAGGGDAKSPIAEDVSRDAEEDAADESDQKVSGAAMLAAAMPLVAPAGFRRGGLPPHAAWQPTGRPRGPNAVRGPPA